MPRYGLATIYEKHTVGHEFTVDNLPLHLTHVDSFEINLNAEELSKKLTDTLEGQKIIKTVALEDEYYGPEKDILVTPLELTPDLFKLQMQMINILQKEGAVFKNPQFVGEYFTPHISVYGDRRVNPGDPVSKRDISLSSKVSDDENANRRVLASFIFR